MFVSMVADGDAGKVDSLLVTGTGDNTPFYPFFKSIFPAGTILLLYMNDSLFFLIILLMAPFSITFTRPMALRPLNCEANDSPKLDLTSTPPPFFSPLQLDLASSQSQFQSSSESSKEKARLKMLDDARLEQLAAEKWRADKASNEHDVAPKDLSSFIIDDSDWEGSKGSDSSLIGDEPPPTPPPSPSGLIL